jgi:hypothetical protein
MVIVLRDLLRWGVALRLPEFMADNGRVGIGMVCSFFGRSNTYAENQMYILLVSE